jgi:hypothetical protein
MLLRQLLTEAQTLDPNAIKKREGRFEQFLQYIRDKNPFYTVDGEAVVIAQSEIKRLQALNDAGEFAGQVMLTDVNGKKWPLGKFLKTPPFGQAVPPGKEGEIGDTENAGKEALIIKPSNIGIADIDFKASDLGKMIVSNKALQSTSYGKAVIEMANQIMRGQPAVIPEEFRRNKPIRAAIIDYAGEYLGVLALVHGQSEFPKKEAFLKWLGSNLNELVLNFPSKTNNPLSDSIATVTNPKTQKQINISSKGQKGGAAPSIAASIIVPDEMRGKKKFQFAIDFIDLLQNESLPKPASVSQIFQAMNLLHSNKPNLIPAEFKKYVPWKPSIMDEVMSSIRGKTPMAKYQEIISKEEGNGTDGGKLAYATKKAVIKAFNSGEVPEFQAAILEILDMNFIQQYADSNSVRTGIVKFYTQWPAKLDGIVTVETKSAATDPSKGAFSFKLKPPGSKADPMPNLDPDDNVVAKPSSISTNRQTAKKIVPKDKPAMTKTSTTRQLK